MKQTFAIALLALFSCGAPMLIPDAGQTPEDAGTPDAGPVTPDAGPLTPTLTSTVLTDGGTFPIRYTCRDTTTTGRVSPPLAWTAIPDAGSYALVMTDTSIDLIHWVLWDVTSLELTEGIANVALPPAPAGAKQTTSYDSTTFGYRGPCPPATHVYRFTLYGLDVATLPGVTTASTRAQVQAAITAHALGSTALSATYGP